MLADIHLPEVVMKISVEFAPVIVHSVNNANCGSVNASQIHEIAV